MSDNGHCKKANLVDFTALSQADFLLGMCGKVSFTPNHSSTPVSAFMNESVNERGTRCGMFNLNHVPSEHR